MEETGGGSLCFDLTDEAGGVRAGLGALTDHSIALLAGVSGGPGAGKGHFYVTGNGRNVNTDTSVHPAPVQNEVMLVEKSLTDRLEDRCVGSGGVGDHCGLNGFTESRCQEEPAMVALEEGGAAGTAASCPAVPGTGVPLDTGLQMLQQSAGGIPDVAVGGEEPMGGGAVTGAQRTCLPIELLPCPGKQQGNCALDMSNGMVDSEDPEVDREDPGVGVMDTEYPGVNGEDPEVDSRDPGLDSEDPGVVDTEDPWGVDIEDPGLDSEDPGVVDTEDPWGVDIEDPGVDTAYNRTAVCSRPGVCDVDCGEVKLANGGLHISSRATCDSSDSDWDSHVDPGTGRETWDCSGDEVPQCPGEDAPAAAELPPSPEVSPTPDSSAKPPSPSPSPPGEPTGDSPLSEHESEEDEAGFGDLSLPVRPQSLRTNPGLPVSLSCDATPLSPDEDGGFYFGDAGYMEECRGAMEAAGRRQSAPDKLPDLSDHTDCSDGTLMPKRFGIADFFTRSLFSRKSKEPKALTHNAAGWRLFGKTGPRGADPTKDQASTVANQQEEEEDEEEDEELKDSDVSPCRERPPAAGRRKNLEFEPLSTTALILEDRPANLPAKSEEETQRHKLEYEEMVAGAKRRELKEAQRKKRQMKERHRQEDIISNAMVIWNTEILPHWDTMKGTRRVRDLWWQGLPPSVRGRVWNLAIGNELNITAELYEIFLSRAKEKWRSYSETSSVNDNESDGGASLADRESSLDLIKLDISRTFPSLFIFQKGGPYHDLLHSVLGAYTCYRPDIGYVQGMSFIAAVLILNLEEAEAFITFANLLNKPCQMAFFRVDHELMLKYFAAFEIFFEENLPRLFSHFQSNSLTPDLYLIDWIFTLYSKSLPLDVACRVWDVFCRDGEESLFRTGLGILRLFEEVLLQMDFIHIAQFLTRLPDDLQSHTLFVAMANTHMISRNRRWAQVFSALTKEGIKEVDKNTSPALRS
ncbi:TBC1 domain family member 12 isoform X2 [Limanda limanda]|uniref:TBC1 domain family member 12 isoform X2 n=1 Tax=Limanda limanda TaxID=27771 RepID=UPI0029C6679C|nr:TBC1 domain family member 12 isoform X2 [Limanda limanda]